MARPGSPGSGGPEARSAASRTAGARRERAPATTAFRRAADLAESRVAVDPTDFDTIFTLAWAQQMLGESEKAKATVARGLAIAPKDPYGFYYDALINVRAGEYELALMSLHIAVDNGYPANILSAEPYLNELRDNPDFQAMISGTN